MKVGALRRGPLLSIPASTARWARKQWSRNSFLDVVDLLSAVDDDEQQQRRSKLANRGLPGFRGAECPSVVDIHILCHVFQNVPWSPSVERHLRQRNFGLTTRQVVQILLRLKDNLTHTLNFFIWAAQQRGYSPSAECFEILKNALHAHGDDVHTLLKDMRLNNRFVPVDVLILLMEVFAEKGMAYCALEVFQSFLKFRSRPDEDAYNTILQILVNAGRIDAALEIFEQMERDKWCRPGTTSFLFIFWGLGKASKVAEARALLGSLKTNSSISVAEAHSQMVGGLCEGGWIDQAEETVLEMYECGIEPDVNVYTSLISAHIKAGRLTEAHRYYEEAVKDGLLVPSMEILTMLIVGFAHQNDTEKANELLTGMKTAGISPSAAVYEAVMQCALKQGQWQLGKKLLDEVVKGGISTAAEVNNAVITACVDAGQFDAAISCVLQMMRVEDMCTGEAVVPALFERMIALDQPEIWQKLLLAMEGAEESLQSSLCSMLAASLAKADKLVANNVLQLMREKGLDQL